MKDMETKRKPRRGAPEMAKAPADHITHVRFVRPSRLFLRFADGLEGTWSFQELALDMTNMKLTSIKTSVPGTSITVKSKWNETVELDASALRAAVDPQYAAELEQAFLAIRGPLDNLKTTANSLPLKSQR